jgi:hypothetical protein
METAVEIEREPTDQANHSSVEIRKNGSIYEIVVEGSRRHEIVTKIISVLMGGAACEAECKLKIMDGVQLSRQ